MPRKAHRKEVTFFCLLGLFCFVIPTGLVVRRYRPLSANTADEVADMVLIQRREAIRSELHARFEGGSTHISDERDPRDDPEYQWDRFRNMIINTVSLPSKRQPSSRQHMPD